MKGYTRVLQLLEPLRRTPTGDLLYAHVRQLLQSEAEDHQAIRLSYQRLLTRLLPQAGGDAELRLLCELLHSSDDAAELTGLADRIEALLQPAAAGTDAVAETLHLLVTDAPEASADPVAGAETEAAWRTSQQQLDERTREIGELERKLETDIGETIRQNQQAGALLEGLLSRLQLAGEMPELIDEPASLAMEIEQFLGVYHAINHRLDDTRRSLRHIATDSQRLHDELSRVRTLSLTDELTRLANRRAFMRDLTGEVARAERDGVPFSLAMIDLDYFKQVNDAYGHAVGDDVLRIYADKVLSVLRRQDMVARYGGEEFVVLMPNTSLEGAEYALEKVRNQLRKIRLAGTGDDIPLPTFSAGATQYRDSDTPDSILRRADVALYQAKQGGRNRTELADAELEDADPSWPLKALQPCI